VVYAFAALDGSQPELYADVDQYVRWRISFVERIRVLLDYETADEIILVADYTGHQVQERSEQSKRAMAEAAKIMNSGYPNMISKIFMVNFPRPRMGNVVYWLLSAFSDTKMATKVRVIGIGPKIIGAGLLPIIPASNLPKPYGGTAEPGWRV